MSAQIIDGVKIAEKVRNRVKEEVANWVAEGHSAPGLATVLVGEAGIQSFGFNLPASSTQEEVEALVRQLNADPKVNGILVQLPLPAGLDEERVLREIKIEKDVDGFHPLNIGRLAQKGRDPLFIPCTPYGCMVLLEEAGVKLSGAKAVVLGRSNIVGMPVALLLVRADATVTICHSRTKDLPAVVREADVLVAAIGKPEMVRGDWVKPGAVVIDVGINRVEDATRPKGYRLVGDVAFDEVKEVASWITPVPGGVGPMTIAMLLQNTLRAAKIVEE
jgi:methylenetetrahydrofolate dehydrogenase (NADP+)/methenyltetrahydrofolate cyclohydrolase